MKLTKLTVTQIWNALKAYRAETSPTNTGRNDVVTLPDSQGSSASSGGSAVTLSGSNVFRPPQLEVSISGYYIQCCSTGLWLKKLNSFGFIFSVHQVFIQVHSAQKKQRTSNC